jgi:hypothetical protein
VTISFWPAAATFLAMPGLAVLFKIAARHGYLRPAPFAVDWLGVAVSNTVVCGLLGQQNLAVGSGASALVALAVLWWRRRRPDRAVRELGAKSRVRIADLIRAMRERAIPRPVLRPIPIPAGGTA